MLIQEKGYQIREIITSTFVARSSIYVNGQTVYLHNVGTYKIYLHSKDLQGTTEGWEISPGEKVGGFTDNDFLYFTTELEGQEGKVKLMFVEV